MNRPPEALDDAAIPEPVIEFARLMRQMRRERLVREAAASPVVNQREAPADGDVSR
jgi:hypothetical protein